jgi:hypothetical protein
MPCKEEEGAYIFGMKQVPVFLTPQKKGAYIFGMKQVPVFLTPQKSN